MQECETSSLVPLFSRVQSSVREAEAEQAQERFFQPHFLQAPGDMLAHEGKLCRLDCKVRFRARGQEMTHKLIFLSFDLIHFSCLLVLQVSGLPTPELMWLVNGKQIYPDLYHKLMVRENGVHSLVIDPLTQKDAGTYTCVASNKAGRSTFSLDLKVVGMNSMIRPPRLLALFSKPPWLKPFPLQKKRWSILPSSWKSCRTWVFPKELLSGWNAEYWVCPLLSSSGRKTMTQYLILKRESRKQLEL